MDLQPHSAAESALLSTTSITGSAPCAGAFFPEATGFNIRGGVFTSNVTNNVCNPTPEQPSEFRTIRLGDLKLRKEIRLNIPSGVVGHQNPGPRVRRMYSAEIRRDPGPVTVAMYCSVSTKVHSSAITSKFPYMEVRRMSGECRTEIFDIFLPFWVEKSKSHRHRCQNCSVHRQPSPVT
ncbi:hypothetical protein C8R45DRAFT_499862 [Mycena sanguinolenta]|nr:hypothetical protein C8R45DRAFT_499862 [Mycena sanguinolenta]